MARRSYKKILENMVCNTAIEWWNNEFALRTDGVTNGAELSKPNPVRIKPDAPYDCTFSVHLKVYEDGTSNTPFKSHFVTVNGILDSKQGIVVTDIEEKGIIIWCVREDARKILRINEFAFIK